MTDAPARLRVIVADEERPARSFLVGLLRSFKDVAVVGEAASGRQAVAIIDKEKPDLAFLEWKMPELDGIGVVRRLKKASMPLIAFVTANDEFAVRAFEVNAVDYLLKPVDKTRLRDTLNRAQDRMERADTSGELQTPAPRHASTRNSYLERIPVRHREEVVIVPVQQIASIVADGEVLNITTLRNERHSITHRLKDLERVLDPAQFIRLGRGTLANVDQIGRVAVIPSGSHVAILANGQKLPVSRIQSRVLRDRLLKL